MTAGRRPIPNGVREKTQAVRSKREPKAAAGKDGGAPAQTVVPALVSGARPPSWLKADHGLQIWERLSPTLAQAKLLTAADADAFGRYCRNFARWLKLQDEMDTGGETYISESQHGTLKRANPAFIMADRLERMLLALEDRFGLNPAERQRIMAARAQSATTGDLFPGVAPKPVDDKARRHGDPAADAAPAAEPISSPLGLLN